MSHHITASRTRTATIEGCAPHSAGTVLWLNAQSSDATRANYARHVARLVAITGKQPEECGLADLQAFHAVLREPPPSLIGQGKLFKTAPAPSSVTAGMQAIKSLYSFMQRAGVIQFNPSLMVKTKSAKQRKRVDVSSVMDFVQKCAVLAHDTSAKPKDRAAAYTVLLLATTGLRASEAGNARLTDVLWVDDRPWLHVLGKGSKNREVVLADWILKLRTSFAANDEWMVPEELRKSGGRLVVWRMVKRAALLTGVAPDKAHPHLLRHFHASVMLDSGVSLAETRDNLGHGNIAVTSGYLHADENKRHDAISAALARFWKPLGESAIDTPQRDC